ncbi:MAG: twin-arginine translocase subunit TatC [Anaerolinea sp.]|nr:twin-arginine translocase subunit TatC [Anaerolinea sp.]
MTSRTKPSPKPVPPPEPQTDIEESGDGHELRMTLLDHLDELRRRLVRAVIALAVGVIIAVPLTEPVLRFLQVPYGERFQILDPTGSIISFFRVALMLGAIISIPLTTYQILMFVLPGLTKNEKRTLFRAIPAITLLFLLGVIFAWSVLIPPALDFLQNFQTDLFKAEWTADGYLGFVTALVFWMGVAFETPLIFFVLALMGMVTAGALAKNWRIAIIASAVAAAFITPTVDPVNMFLVMGPLMALYLLSIVLVLIGRRISKVDTTS